MAVGRPLIRAAWLRPARDGAILACLGLVLAHAMGLLDIGVDAHTYWTVDPADPYGGTRPGETDTYFYAPPFAQLVGPLQAIPWPWFAALWTLLLTAALVWQAGLWTAPVILMVPVFAEMTVGNIHLLIGAAILLGFRWPWTWSLLLLTKVTPGLGLLWFAARREWRSLAIALGATAAIAGVSFVLAPGLWFEWVSVLVDATGAEAWPFTIQVPLPVRLALAAAVVVWGARTDRRWALPVAATLALPVLWVNGLAILVAAIPLVVGAEQSPAARWLARHAPGPAPVAPVAPAASAHPVAPA